MAEVSTQAGVKTKEKPDKLSEKEKDLLGSWAKVVRVVPASLTDNE
jgi:hypothetical protein